MNNLVNMNKPDGSNDSQSTNNILGIDVQTLYVALVGTAAMYYIIRKYEDKNSSLRGWIFGANSTTKDRRHKRRHKNKRFYKNRDRYEISESSQTTSYDGDK